MTGIRRSPEETARPGCATYERAIRPRVEAGHHGKIVSVDVED